MTWRNDKVCTCRTIKRQLDALGIRSGDVVLAHCAMKSFGYVVGGPQAVIEALLDVIGKDGTLVMPTFTGAISDPAFWRNPPFAPRVHDEIRDNMLAFDPAKSPTRGMGIVAEYFRSYPGAVRSAHPQASFTAHGRDAEMIVDGHSFDYRFGPSSPLGKLYEKQSKELLLGVHVSSLTGFYLTNHFNPSFCGDKEVNLPLATANGGIQWARHVEKNYSSEWFADAAEHLLKLGLARQRLFDESLWFVNEYPRSVDAVVAWRETRMSDSAQ